MGPSDVASRFAIVLRIWVSGTSSYAAPVRSGNGKRETGNVAAAAAVGPADAPGLGARSRSFLTTRPPGPEPVTSLRTTPASFPARTANGAGGRSGPQARDALSAGRPRRYDGSRACDQPSRVSLADPSRRRDV